MVMQVVQKHVLNRILPGLRRDTIGGIGRVTVAPLVKKLKRGDRGKQQADQDILQIVHRRAIGSRTILRRTFKVRQSEARPIANAMCVGTVDCYHWGTAPGRRARKITLIGLYPWHTSSNTVCTMPG